MAVYSALILQASVPFNTNSSFFLTLFDYPYKF